MLYIYKYTNKVNGKIYIGQTNNLKLRYRGHKSAAFNPRSNDYDAPLHRAFRKYGLENFDFEPVLELDLEDTDDNREIISEWEQYYIEHYDSKVENGKGYNIKDGGVNGGRYKMEFERILQLSTLFKPEEILDIQDMLVNNATYDEITSKYKKLSRSLLSNINTGYNYKNPDLDYPLKKEFWKSEFSEEEIQSIKNDIKSGMPYSEISKRHRGISAGYISSINTGYYFKDENETYPLFVKECNDKKLIRQITQDLLWSDDPIRVVAERNGRKQDSVKKLHRGEVHKKKFFKYPLRDYREENQQAFIDNYKEIE